MKFFLLHFKKKQRAHAAKLLLFVMLCCSLYSGKTYAAPEVSAPSYIVMEASTGQVVCENNADERKSPASITKIMTLLITFDQLEKGRIHLDDLVVTSARAKSMGGSQVFLEEGEVQTLETLIKCIAISSGNDASVAVAEYVAGSEDEFVEMMNKRAEELGMTGTHFLDCCGLSDSDMHYTTARDVALMSKELITRYPQVLHYTRIWMEDIVHRTRQGESVFTLSSTNKLLKTYEWTTGLKTGSTSKALYCLSATAKKDDIEMIAVVLGAPTNKSRFEDALNLLNFGYSVSQLYVDENKDLLPLMPVRGGVEEQVKLAYGGTFKYLDVTGADLSQIEKTLLLDDEVEAPVEEGKAVGEIVYKLGGKRIGSVSVVTAKKVEKAGYTDYLKQLVNRFLLCYS